MCLWTPFPAFFIFCSYVFVAAPVYDYTSEFDDTDDTDTDDTEEPADAQAGGVRLVRFI